MTWHDVVRRDLVSSYRSRLLPSLLAGFVLLTAGVLGLLLWTAPPSRSPQMETAVLTFASIVAVVAPLLALQASYAAVVEERTSGSVRFLLGLPNSRLDAYAGKYVSRGLVVAGTLGAGTLLSAVVVGVGYENGSMGDVLLLGAASLLLLLVFVGIGLAVSASVSTASRAYGVTIGVYLLFRVGWAAGQWFALDRTGAEFRPPYPEWYYWLGRVNPLNAYVRLTLEFGGAADVTPLLSSAEGVDSFATTAEFAVVVLLAWAVAVPALGYLQFDRADLL